MYKLLMAIGIVVMFLVGTILGIQFMVASAEDKAKVKEALIPYIIGCIVIFGAFTIWSIAVNVGQDIVPTQEGSGSGSGSSSSITPPTTTYTEKEDGSRYCTECDIRLTEMMLANGKCGCGRIIKGKAQATYPFKLIKGTWYWCAGCDRELTEAEEKDLKCSKNRSHRVKKITEKYICTKCGDPWDEGEKRQQACDNCRPK